MRNIVISNKKELSQHLFSELSFKSDTLHLLHTMFLLNFSFIFNLWIHFPLFCTLATAAAQYYSTQQVPPRGNNLKPWLMGMNKLGQEKCLDALPWLMVKQNTGQSGRYVTCNKVLLEPQLHGAPVNGGGNKQQARLGAEDSERWRKALAHTAFRTRLSPACCCQQQQREPQPFHYPPLGAGQLEDRRKWVMSWSGNKDGLPQDNLATGRKLLACRETWSKRRTTV